MRPADTWICVTDGARAQLYRCDHPGQDPEPLLDYVLRAQPRVSADETAETRFAGRVAVHLDRAAGGHLFEHLVLVAPHTMMGALLNTMDEHTRRLVVFELERDLVHATPRQLATHLCGALPH